jgi:hypothetical protein
MTTYFNHADMAPFESPHPPLHFDDRCSVRSRPYTHFGKKVEIERTQFGCLSRPGTYWYQRVSIRNEADQGVRYLTRAACIGLDSDHGPRREKASCYQLLAKRNSREMTSSSHSETLLGPLTPQCLTTGKKRKKARPAELIFAHHCLL